MARMPDGSKAETDRNADRREVVTCVPAARPRENLFGTAPERQLHRHRGSAFQSLATLPVMPARDDPPAPKRHGQPRPKPKPKASVPQVSPTTHRITREISARRRAALRELAKR